MSQPPGPSRKVIKRQHCLDWDDYFMATALLAAKRSKDPETQVGACIVNEKKIILGTGYNGMPRGCSDLSWCRKKENPEDNKHLYVCHAEVNAILNKNSQNLEGSTIYVTLFPCNECAKLIIQSGIKNIVYMSDKYADKLYTRASKHLLDKVDIKYRKFEPKNRKIEIVFSDDDDY